MPEHIKDLEIVEVTEDLLKLQLEATINALNSINAYKLSTEERERLFPILANMEMTVGRIGSQVYEKDLDFSDDGSENLPDVDMTKDI